MTVEQFLQEQNDAIKALHIASTSSSWMAATTGKDEWNQKTAEASTAYNLYYADPERFEQVKAYLKQDDLTDIQRRQLEVLYNGMAENQIAESDLKEMVERSTELVGLFNTFRATIGDKEVSENDVRQILVKSNDLVEREEAWHASKQIAKEVEAKLLTLVKKRNEVARSLGYDNYHQMSFKLQELDRDEVFSIFDKLKDLSDEPFREMKSEMDTELAERFGISVDELRPWHYADPFFQEAPPMKELDLDPFYVGKDLEQLTIATFESMGMEIKDMLAKSDMYPRDKKNQHAFCTDIDREGDVRVLCNNVPSDYWSCTTLHEFGHAVYFKYVDESLPFLLRTCAHTLTTEAIAMLYGRFAKNPEWLERYLEIDETEVNRLTPIIEESLRRQMLIAGRWIMTFSYFERELYENPDQDLNRLWWKLVKDIQFVNPPENVDYPHWAAKIHFTLVPVYYQNYLLGELTTSQLEAYIYKNVSADMFTKEVGTYLIKDYFKPGAIYAWNEKIEKATGEKLNPQYFIDQFVAVKQANS
ncbi:oligoendopeptidase F [Sporosarcina sp. NCCP-2222]|uniref:M2 family metallopeptidase n=1 Tax=Sporosarcina sp. NCCP-2222 TaxID=2935073 RepID=UPI002085D40D|nr:M2 family metallopeptidase [Sporosarcina sp. NCCP-2222]GKV56415.1 oligoendopeptidase F [Sporosarcina sp. NCCP-2222]